MKTYKLIQYFDYTMQIIGINVQIKLREGEEIECSIELILETEINALIFGSKGDLIIILHLC